MNLLTRMLTSALLYLAAMPYAYPQQNLVDENIIKAAFIYKYALYTRWPDNTENGRLILCSMGRDSVVSILDNLVGKMVRGRQIVVQSLHEDSVPETCNLLYVASSERGSYRSYIAVNNKRPLLTISELNGFVKAGGIVEFFVKDNRIRFDVNLDEAKNSGLVIRSQLLRLARNVVMEKTSSEER